MAAPHYQVILDKDIPAVTLDDRGGFIRVIAGDYLGTKGAALIFTPINLWDMRMKKGHNVDLQLPTGFTAMLLVLQGAVLVDGTKPIKCKELAIFEREGNLIPLAVTDDTLCLLLNGKPIDEPIVGHGPFVMNTQDEIDQAVADYRAGRF